MKVTGLDGKLYQWNLTGKAVLGVDQRERSGLHVTCRHLLREFYTTERILEEVYLPGSGSLYLDFYLPVRQLAIEVQGRQHYEFSLFFHMTRSNFLFSQQRDRNKAEWCEINNITLLALLEKDFNEWRQLIRAEATGKNPG